jgi:hypothetical protein
MHRQAYRLRADLIAIQLSTRTIGGTTKFAHAAPKEENVANSVTLIAILKDEDKFVDEWIAYHRLVGVDHFILYDDDPQQHLKQVLLPHATYVTFYDWTEPYNVGNGRDKQTRAYRHGLLHATSKWVGFIDIDEFIVLRRHKDVHSFLAEFDDAHAVLLTWHLFGHNGVFDHLPGLVTESLTKRQMRPGRMMKTIVLRDAAREIKSAHTCSVQNRELVFDANHNRFTIDQYPNKTAVAHINHYVCRSFTIWMARVQRGCLSYEPPPIRPIARGGMRNKNACANS